MAGINLKKELDKLIASKGTKSKLRKIKFIKDTEKFTIGEEALSNENSAESYVNNGFAIYIDEEKAFSNFKEISQLQTDEEKHRAWLKAYYEGLYFSIGENGKDCILWQQEKEKYVYSDKRFNEPIECIDGVYRAQPNKAQRNKRILVVEFDDKNEQGEKDKVKCAENLEKVKEKLKELNIGYIESSHKGACNYLWIMSTRDLTTKEAELLLKWIAPENSEVDTNFCSDNKRFPVLFSKHWKYSTRETPLEFVEGNMIDFDSLNITKEIKGKSKTVVKKDGFRYETFVKEPTLEKPERLLSPQEILKEIKNIYSKYIDTSEQNIEILSHWVIGTYQHSNFETYPIIQLYAQKRSGKTRTLKLCSSLCKGSDGSITTSPTETLLFRHNGGALFFDEMETIGSKERAAFRETLNTIYKRGNKIIRYREVKKLDGTKDYEEKIFQPYYPVGLANVNGIDNILGDRAIQLILQRSNKPCTKLTEDFSTNEEIKHLKSQLAYLQLEIPQKIFSEWNNYIEKKKYDSNLKELFDKINDTGIFGRYLELFMPLFLIANYCGDLDSFLQIAKDYVERHTEEENISDFDELLKRFIQAVESKEYLYVYDLFSRFRASIENPEDWVNVKWFGRALKRLGLIQRKRIYNGKSQVLLNNNPTNSTNSLNTINPTNPTKTVGLGELVGFGGEKIHIHNPTKGDKTDSYYGEKGIKAEYL